MVVRLSRRVSYICTFVFNWFHLVLHISLGIGSGRWWNEERERFKFLASFAFGALDFLTSLQSACNISHFLFGLFSPNDIDFNERTVPRHSYIRFYELCSVFQKYSPSFLSFNRIVRSFSVCRCFSFIHKLFFALTPAFHFFFALPLVFAHCSLGLFITVACMKRRKHEKWRKKTWNRLNSEIKPATSMCMCTPMKGNGMVHNYQRKIILLLYYTTSAFRKSRYIRPRAYITLQFHLIFRA